MHTNALGFHNFPPYPEAELRGILLIKSLIPNLDEVISSEIHAYFQGLLLQIRC